MFPDIATEVSVMRNNKNSSLIAATLTLALGAGAAWAANPANPGDAPTTTPSGRTPSGQVMPGGSEGAKTDATVVPQPRGRARVSAHPQLGLGTGRGARAVLERGQGRARAPRVALDGVVEAPHRGGTWVALGIVTPIRGLRARRGPARRQAPQTPRSVHDRPSTHGHGTLRGDPRINGAVRPARRRSVPSL